MDCGYVGLYVAAAEIGLRHKLRELARSQGEDQADLPIIHYCYASSSAEHDWYWDKRILQALGKGPRSAYEVPSVDKALIGLLNEWVAMPEHQICLYEA